MSHRNGFAPRLQHLLRRPLATTAGLTIAAALAIPATVGAQTPTQDSAVGNGNTLFFKDIHFGAQSGPSGENPSGFSTFVFVGFPGVQAPFTASTITCLHVDGNTATFAGTLEPNILGHPYGVLTVVDNGPANSGLDTFAPTSGFQPFDCSIPNVLNQQNLIDGDIVVVDAPPLPTSIEQCKNEGWQSFGAFKNQGDCVSFVVTGGQNQPRG
jgi:hypothetical protein